MKTYGIWIGYIGIALGLGAAWYALDQPEREVLDKPTPYKLVGAGELKVAARAQPPLLAMNEYYDMEAFAQAAREHKKPGVEKSLRDIKALWVIAEPLTENNCMQAVNGICTSYGESYNTAKHPYYDYPVKSLEAMARGDAAAAQVLAEHFAFEDKELALEYALHSAALSGKPGAILKLTELYSKEGKPDYRLRLLVSKLAPNNLFADAPHEKYVTAQVEADAAQLMLRIEEIGREISL